jgi:hypothetical protein
MLFIRNFDVLWFYDFEYNIFVLDILACEKPADLTFDLRLGGSFESVTFRLPDDHQHSAFLVSPQYFYEFPQACFFSLLLNCKLVI